MSISLKAAAISVAAFAADPNSPSAFPKCNVANNLKV